MRPSQFQSQQKVDSTPEKSRLESNQPVTACDVLLCGSANAADNVEDPEATEPRSLQMAFDGNEEPMTQPMQTSVVSNSDAAEMPPKVQPLAADLATECTMLSLRVFLPDGQPSRSFEYLTNEMVRAASTNNLLYQWNATGNEYFRIELQRSLQEGVSRFKRNSLDLAGKLPFTIKILSLGFGARDSPRLAACTAQTTE